MYRFIGTIIAVTGLALGSSPASEAHGIAHNGYDSPRHYHSDYYYERRMPQWLWRKKGFRHWYFRSGLRYNRHLAWSELYEIYRWERRFDHRRRHKRNYYARHHDYNWYRRYWRDYEYRDRRHKPNRPRHRRH